MARGADPEFLVDMGFQPEMPWRARRYFLARWARMRPDEVDEMDWHEVMDLQAVIDGHETAREHAAIRAHEKVGL